MSTPTTVLPSALHRARPAVTPLARRALLGGLLGLGLAGCGSAPKVEDAARELPRLELPRYFNGRLRAHGLFRDRQGQVQRRFQVDLTARWQGEAGAESGVIDERFTYLDAAHQGQTEQRIWQLRRTGTEGGTALYEGRADDVQGVAQGRVAGNALNWRYSLRLPVDGRVYEVDFDDWMYLMDDRTLVNQAVMSKWGLRLGEVLISFEKLD